MKIQEGLLGWRKKGIVAIAVPVIALVFLMGVFIIPAVVPQQAHADHNDMYVVCPSPIEEGETGHMQVRWPGYAVVGATVFTYQGGHTASGNDFVSYHGEKMNSDSDDDALWVPAITIEDSNPEHDETFRIGIWVDGIWHGCVVTIEDDDTPWIKYVELSSRPVNGEKYRARESIDITVAFDQEVEADGDPLVILNLGEEGDEDDERERTAAYHSGSGTKYLVFRYEVQTIDRDIDGVSVSAGEVDSDGVPVSGFSGTGNIYAKDTDVPIDYTHRGVSPSSDHKVDGRPYVQSVSITSAPPEEWDAYRANQVIELTMSFNTDVLVEGSVLAGLYVGYYGDNTDEALREARYLRGSGTDTLVFGYTVKPGDMDPRGVMVEPGGSDTGFRGSGTIKAKGTEVELDPSYDGTNHLEDHRVDTAAPNISSIGFLSFPKDGDAYRAGETIEVEIAFDQQVTIEGDPILELDVGGTVKQADLRSPGSQPNSAEEWGFGDTIVFHYTVQEGDNDTDGVGISANSLILNSGGIHDSAGNSAALSHEAVAADPGQKVDASTQEGESSSP